jgi:hypothetical protein
VKPFQDLLDAQEALFATGVTRTYDWRIDQLDRMAQMIDENEHRPPEGNRSRLQDRLGIYDKRLHPVP